jgi:16S rRNA (uracil1498-N3)-methyltransferase
MNLILLLKEDFLPFGDRVRITDRRLKHVLSVQGASRGDELAVGLLGGRIGTGTVVRLDGEALEMDVRLERDPPQKLPLTLVLSLPRPKVLRRILRTMSSLGVERIVLLNSFRVEKSYWQTPFLNEAQVKEQLVLGLEQAKDTVLPEVLLRPLFKPFVEDELPGLVRGTLPLVAHPSAAEPCPRGLTRPATLAIGPEGGFIPYEIDLLVSCGFLPVSLGERILTVEAAVPALISKLF